MYSVHFKRVCVGAGGNLESGWLHISSSVIIHFLCCYLGEEYSPACTNPAWPYLHRITFNPSGLACKKLASNLGNWYTFNRSPVPEKTIERGFRGSVVSLQLYDQKNSQFILVCSWRNRLISIFLILYQLSISMSVMAYLGFPPMGILKLI